MGQGIVNAQQVLHAQRPVIQAVAGQGLLAPDGAAAECLFIDDMPLNIAGAYQAGIPGFIFRDNLEELEALVFGKQ